QPAVPVEVLVGPDHAAILPLELLELIHEVVDGTFAVFATLEERDEAELARVGAPRRSDRRREPVAVLAPQELPIGADVPEDREIVEAAVVVRLQLPPLEVPHQAGPAGRRLPA